MIKDIARWVVLGGVFLLPFLPLVVANSLFFPFITGKNFFFRIIVEVVFAAWIILALLDARYRPRFSYILAGFGALIGIMAVANALGESPLKSFWSNYERMDGYVTLFHLGLYFLVAGSVLQTDRLWNAFWNTSIVVAVFMMLYGFCQLSGSESCPISQSDYRVDGRMGNAAYMAIYMFFHVFLAIFMMLRTHALSRRTIYVILALGFAFMLFQTATRGTALALVGGTCVSAVYIAFFGHGQAFMRKVAIGAAAAVILLAAGFLAIRDSEFVASNQILSRLASISLRDGETRFTIWSLALEGVKERPLLGWGQENFNYVFNKYYKAELYAQEPWFDRVHNLILDWLIAGGFLGLAAYLFVLLSAVYYLLVRPFTHPAEESFSVGERGVLLGLLAGYTAHNLLVFDNLISYLFFVSVLAMIHMRHGREIPQLTQKRFSTQTIEQVVAPTIAVVLCVSIYMVNVPPLQAASDLIKGFQATDPTLRLRHFTTALERNSFAAQEIREQLVRMTQELVNSRDVLLNQIRTQNPSLSDEDARSRIQGIIDSYATLSEEELEKQLVATPEDVRILVFQAAFFRFLGRHDQAISTLERASVLSPEKQQIYFELGLAYEAMGNPHKALETFKYAFELEPRNRQARMFYAAGLIYGDDMETLRSIITPEYEADYNTDNIIVSALYNRKRYAELEDILHYRVAQNPSDAQMHMSLAWTQDALGRPLDAVKTLEAAIAAKPTDAQFKKDAEQRIEELRARALLLK